MSKITAKQYARKHYYSYPTYMKIAEDAFKAGQENEIPSNVKDLENELKKTKEELKSLWRTIEDPDAFAELIAGI